MSDDKIDLDNQGLSDLKFSIRTLWDKVGSTDSIGLGIVINVGLGLLGLPFVWIGLNQMAGIAGLVVAFIGAVWALLNIMPVIQWVLGL